MKRIFTAIGNIFGFILAAFIILVQVILALVPVAIVIGGIWLYRNYRASRVERQESDWAQTFDSVVTDAESIAVEIFTADAPVPFALVTGRRAAVGLSYHVTPQETMFAIPNDELPFIICVQRNLLTSDQIALVVRSLPNQDILYFGVDSTGESAIGVAIYSRGGE